MLQIAPWFRDKPIENLGLHSGPMPRLSGHRMLVFPEEYRSGSSPNIDAGSGFVSPPVSTVPHNFSAQPRPRSLNSRDTGDRTSTTSTNSTLGSEAFLQLLVSTVEPESISPRQSRGVQSQAGPSRGHTVRRRSWLSINSREGGANIRDGIEEPSKPSSLDMEKLEEKTPATSRLLDQIKENLLKKERKPSSPLSQKLHEFLPESGRPMRPHSHKERPRSDSSSGAVSYNNSRLSMDLEQRALAPPMTHLEYMTRQGAAHNGYRKASREAPDITSGDVPPSRSSLYIQSNSQASENDSERSHKDSADSHNLSGLGLPRQEQTIITAEQHQAALAQVAYLHSLIADSHE